MTGHDLRRKRTELGITLEEIADDTDLNADTLAQIELYDLRLSREDARLVQLGFWTIQSRRIMAESGLPECEWVNNLLKENDQPDLYLLESHTAKCEICRARDAYAHRHAPRMPGAQGWAFTILDALRHRSPPLAAIITGIIVVLAVTGIPILIAIISGIVSRDMERVGEGGFAIGMIAAGGAAAGLMHYATADLRDRNNFGFYAS